MGPVLEVDGLWQSFRPKTRRGGRRRGPVTRWALRDVNLAVQPGETVGVVGTNGSGKSTLLRTAAGVYRPERGRVRVRGRVSSLLDLESGLNRDLTARENLLIGGVLLGLTRQEVRERYARIVGFSGLDEHALNQPLSSFSSGMELRLTFSVVLNSDPTVLLVDEVLAVGDEEFRRQCADRLDELRGSGCGVLLVSHDLGLIATHCNRVVVLDRGSVVFTGPPREAIERYRVEAVDAPFGDAEGETPARSAVDDLPEPLLRDPAVPDAGEPGERGR
jgi:ABC-type polysaccharide/polyol phosphate transport system ATPase subunit